MTGPVPTFLVAGAGRSGTTALVEGLRSHPDAFVTSPKEPHYFALHGAPADFRGPGDETTINQTVVTELGDYLALYSEAESHRALGEGSVSTLYHHERAIAEILRVNPAMKVVILLREPVARAYSSFQYLRAQGREPEEDFLVALGLEEQRKDDNWHHLWHYSAMSRYADAVEAFRTHLLPGHVLILFHDDLERDWAGTYARVLDFLDLPAVAESSVGRVNISGVPRFQHLQRLLWWAAERPALRRAVRATTSWRFREAVKSRLIQRQSLPREVLGEVASRFADDLGRLHELLGDEMPLPPWLSPRPQAH